MSIMNDKKKHSEEESDKIANEVPDKTAEMADVMPADGQTEKEDIESVASEEGDELEALKNALQERQEALEKEKNEYLFLMAEFDNFKKRTMREKAEILKNGAENVLKGLLPIIDDFERGMDAIKGTSDAASVKEGMELIYNKFIKYLNQNGVKEIPTKDVTFDVDIHEAIAMVPVEDESQKGKVIDTVQKGYKLNDKVIRHAKVVVAQ